MTDNSDEIFQTLRRIVHEDPVLSTRLFALTDADSFIAVVQQLAHSQGHALPAEEVRQAMRAGRKFWSDRKRP